MEHLHLSILHLLRGLWERELQNTSAETEDLEDSVLRGVQSYIL